ncbi:hypothetical protein ACFQ1E_17225 [Sphingomonas canadensis]|uniref:Transposase n=1 Tax=Sphingomonas canadensis TaxID=1219257 RepID=A0ABW3H9G1_9SPHN|nr:hypothetical protein [Sphingomonas canadensis]
MPCPDDPAMRCWSDAQIAEVIAGREKALDDRDAQLCWLRVWFGYPPCP